MRMKTIIEYLIYDKSLKVKCITKTEGDSHTANIYTLLTADVELILKIISVIKDIWQAILILSGCLFLLYSAEPDAGTVIVIAMISYQVINFIMTFIMAKAEAQHLIYKDKRVSLQSDLIEGMKQIKFLSWEGIFYKKIMKIRKCEFKMLSIYKALDGFGAVFWNNISYILLCIFVIYSVNNGKDLQELNIFSLIAIFNTMIFPLCVLPWSLSIGYTSLISFNRFSQFLNQDEINFEDRIQPESFQSQYAIIMNNSNYFWPNAEQIQEDVKQNQIIDEELIIANQNCQKFKIKIANLKFEKKTLNFIIGKIGSGKSAFFQAILNELQIQNLFNDLSDTQQNLDLSFDLGVNETVKQIQMTGRIGYCSQVSWIQNLSIKDNILFGEPFNQELYDKVIDVCQLHQDLKSFENQDQHLIGPDGKNISGGQKQRIALARALYQQRDIYLFDDILSSLDHNIADLIFQNVIVDYLIKNGKTVLLITSNYSYIKIAQQQIKTKVILVDNGEITEDQEVIGQYLQNKSYQQETPSYIEKELDSVLKQENNTLNSDKGEQNEQVVIDDSNEDTRQIGSINWQIWKTYFNSMKFPLFLLLFFVNFYMQGSMSLIDFWLKSEVQQEDKWLHQITKYFDNSFPKTLFYLTTLAVLITVIRQALEVICALLASWSIFKKLNTVLMCTVMKFYDRTNAGQIINRIQDDTYVVDMDIGSGIHCFLENLSRISGLSIGLLILEPRYFLMLVIFLVAFYHIKKACLISNREIKRLQSANQSRLLQIVNETLTGVKIIRAFQKEKYFTQIFESSFSNLMLSNQCGERIKLWFQVRLNLMNNFIVMCTSFMVICSLVFEWSEDFGIQALAITYSMIVLDSFYDCFIQYSRVETGMISVERIQEYLNNETEDINQEQFMEQELQSTHLRETTYAIEFKNVDFYYDNNHKALKNFTLTISKGQKIAIIGRTGSGKTSILNVLQGLYPFQSGDLYINGTNVKQQSLKQWRSQLSIIPQFGFLFSANVKENLDPEGMFTDQQIEKFIQNTQFYQQRNSNINNLMYLDYKFDISQNGANLSCGEKQVLNFLRIVLQNKDIICLDEATSNMDPYTNQLLNESLIEFSKDKTLLVITHRLENIQQYDQIVVMEQGEIVEQGSYQDLMLSTIGYFRKLINNHTKTVNQI
ncbi:unnamed protein product (macronuclear) [Paramecium tetraurelia]|uniref:ABC transporter n=1 Tax=Paramecium tetraurelia TaxID=5888 RepID=A0C134_PARTE|nr:uncharacterized protein GSPATT00033977001 [Paramecium tetraurelia]CAK64501.1 unnamed protein product [Paramecium tetraurelia]|eukprot:XP_001431899.1 hypothetical protein (macronuclear) [Paramecium tetraurelia strain d4-2]